MGKKKTQTWIDTRSFGRLPANRSARRAHQKVTGKATPILRKPAVSNG